LVLFLEFVFGIPEIAITKKYLLFSQPTWKSVESGSSSVHFALRRLVREHSENRREEEELLVGVVRGSLLMHGVFNHTNNS
jgi:hypothetical protein